MANKTKGPGRPTGSPNLKTAFPRSENFGPIRVTEGFNKTVAEIKQNGSTKYKSKSDIMHAALQVLAARELPATFFWINKIQ